MTILERIEFNHRQFLERIIGAGICTVIIIASFLYKEIVYSGPVICPLRLFLGVPCPGCGLTRSFCAMANAQFIISFSHNIFGPILFVGLILAVPLLLVEAFYKIRFVHIARACSSQSLGKAVGASLIFYHGIRLAYMSYSGELLKSIESSLLGIILKPFSLLIFQ